MTAFDLILEGGRLVTDQDVWTADIGIKDGVIQAIGTDLGHADRTLDARGRLVLPGGVDSHCHIEQETSTGLVPCDDFYSASLAAACGGTTTLIPFACQHRGQAPREVVEAYHRRAEKAAVDYAFHLIVTDPTPQVLGQDLPALIRDGYTSFKIYMTYERLRLADRQILDLLDLARQERALVMVHAESHDIIGWLTERLNERRLTAPRHHTIAHHPLAEREATYRAITLSEVVGTAILIVHVSSAQAVDQIRQAQQAGLPIFAETCPQYLVLSEEKLGSPGFEGAKYLCSPPLRGAEDQDALWAGLSEDVLQVVSSDHSAYRFDDPKGKMMHGRGAPFHKVPMGLPGLEARLPILFSEGVGKGRIGLQRFAELSATNHAKLYGLYPRKGTIAVGSDADLVVWDAERETVIRSETLHDDLDYTPYEGMALRGLPVVTVSRGEIVFEEGQVNLRRGRGAFLSCAEPDARALARAQPSPSEQIASLAAAQGEGET